jgi:hypothetical protein
MDKKIILHIPHSSINIPYTEGYVVQDYKLEQEILKLTDWYTDDLFYSKDDEKIYVVERTPEGKREYREYSEVFSP